MSKKRDRKNKIANTPSKPEHKRDFSIDIAGMYFGFDSDEIDALEQAYAKKGEPLVTEQDYRRAFERGLFNGGA